MRKVLAFIVLLLCNVFAFATDTLSISNKRAVFLTRPYFSQLEDARGNLTINDIVNTNQFHTVKTKFPFISYTDSVIWVKLILKNSTSEPYLPVIINNGVIDEFDLYKIGRDNNAVRIQSSKLLRYKSTPDHNGRLINCPLLPDSVSALYLRIRSNDAMAIPIKIESAQMFLKENASGKLVAGFFMGIIIIMMLYNLMLFIMVKDRSYFYYVLYIIFFGLTQWESHRFNSSYFALNNTWFNYYIIPLTRICFWYAILLFVAEFLQLKQNSYKIYRRYYYGLYILVTVPIITMLLGFTSLTYSLTTIAAFINSVVLLIIGISLYIKGFKPAKFFMLGWSLFLLTIVFSIARNKGLFLYSDLTANIVLFGSAFELVMFSIALADRINFYRKQNNEAQLLALDIARENERLITDQNIMLEQKVNERTQELFQSNNNLSAMIENLKSAQAQLIETEKMASLGQLTAGIAHEINNPINFVSANIRPLRMDFNDVFHVIDLYRAWQNNPADTSLKQKAEDYIKEIDIDYIKDEVLKLLDGIEEGANRTTEIVLSLRTFSRTGDLKLKPADINKTILSTLVVLRSAIPYDIEIKPVLDKLPLLNCYPGKIAQVFTNLINNSIQAIKAKPVHVNEYVLITTKDYPENIVIEITDTGVGMTDEVKQRIFDPFFTTKDIGEGTGLGLSIVFGIIEQHHGAIEVHSKPGEGCRITVMLPKTL